MQKFCLFCKFANKELETHILYEDDIALVFLDIDQKVLGHTLVIPKQHYEDITEIPDDILIHLKHLMIKVSNIILETFNKNAVSYIVNYKDSQVIKHLHIHICPNFNFEENTTLSEQEIYDILKDKFKNL